MNVGRIFRKLAKIAAVAAVLLPSLVQAFIPLPISPPGDAGGTDQRQSAVHKDVETRSSTSYRQGGLGIVTTCDEGALNRPCLVQEDADGNGSVEDAADAVFIPITDDRGNVMGVADADGNLIEKLYYSSTGLAKSFDPNGVETTDDDYGQPVYRSRYIRFGFTGMYVEPLTGKRHAHFRDYDPIHGMWLSRDPIAEAGGINLTAFCGGDPVNNIDPLGLASETRTFEATIIDGQPMVRRRTVEWSFLKGGRGSAREVSGSRTGWVPATEEDWIWFNQGDDGQWQSVGYGMAAGRLFGSRVEGEAKGFALFMAAAAGSGAAVALAPYFMPAVVEAGKAATPYVIEAAKSEVGRRIGSGAAGTAYYLIISGATGQDPSWGGAIGSFGGGAIGGRPGVFFYAVSSQGIDLMTGRQEDPSISEFALDVSLGLGFNQLSRYIKSLPTKIPVDRFNRAMDAADLLERRNGAARRAAQSALKNTNQYITDNRIEETVNALSDTMFGLIGEGVDAKTGNDAK